MLRETLYQRPLLTAGVCALCIAGALSLVFAKSDLFTSRRSNRIYFYDVDRGSLFPDHWESHDQPAPSGGLRVIAYVYSCGDCKDESSRFTAYLERAEDGATTVALPETPLQWVSPATRAGVVVINRVNSTAPCEIPRQCTP